MKFRWLSFCVALLCAACASSSGTETGNPPTRTVCDPPITLTVTDEARGGPVAGVVVDDDALVCKQEAESTVCRLIAEAYATPGIHQLVVAATGYETSVVEVTVEAKERTALDPCGYEPALAAVRMIPSSD